MFQNLLVLVMGSDPKPVEDIAFSDRERSMGAGDARGPEWPDLLQSQRGMKRIGLKDRELLVCLPLHLNGQFIVPLPESCKGS